MNFYQFNIGDYRRDTQGLSITEHYIYRTLLDECFLTESPLTTDNRELIRLLRLTSDQIDDLMYVLDKFFELTDDGYINDRVNFELSKTYIKSDKARASANRRWHRNERKANAKKPDANALPTHSEGNANGMLPQYPITPIPQDSSAKKRTASAGANGKFKKPTIKEVQDYLDELGETRFTGQMFVDSNDAKGWVVGKTKSPMKKWTAVVRTWRTYRDQDDNQHKPDFGKGGV